MAAQARREGREGEGRDNEGRDSEVRESEGVVRGRARGRENAGDGGRGTGIS